MQIKPSSGTEWQTVYWRYIGTQAVINDIAPDNYDIRVRSVNNAGFESDWFTVNGDVYGKTAPPPDVEKLYLDGEILYWTYPNPPLDLAGFEVRIHHGTRQTWADATPMHVGILSGSQFNIGSESGTKTYLVNAIDTSGNVSVDPAVVTVNLGDAPTNNVILTTDHKALGWTATVNGTIVSDHIEANQVGGFYGESSAVFYSQIGGDLFYQGSYLESSYVAWYSVSSQDAGSTLILTTETEDTDGYMLEVAEPGSAQFVPFSGVINNAKQGSHYLKIRIPAQSGSAAPKITEFSISLDVDDITESFENITIAAGGTRLPITRSYRGIKYVTLTMQTDASGVTSLKVDDKDEINGPLIYAYNSSGTAVTTSIDAFIRGY